MCVTTYSVSGRLLNGMKVSPEHPQFLEIEEAESFAADFSNTVKGLDWIRIDASDGSYSREFDVQAVR